MISAIVSIFWFLVVVETFQRKFWMAHDARVGSREGWFSKLAFVLKKRGSTQPDLVWDFTWAFVQALRVSIVFFVGESVSLFFLLLFLIVWQLLESVLVYSKPRWTFGLIAIAITWLCLLAQSSAVGIPTTGAILYLQDRTWSGFGLLDTVFSPVLFLLSILCGVLFYGLHPLNYRIDLGSLRGPRIEFDRLFSRLGFFCWCIFVTSFHFGNKGLLLRLALATVFYVFIQTALKYLPTFDIKSGQRLVLKTALPLAIFCWLGTVAIQVVFSFVSVGGDS